MTALIINSGFVAFMEITAVLTVIYPLQKRARYKRYFAAVSVLFIAACIVERIILNTYDNSNCLWLVFELANFLFISFLVRSVTKRGAIVCMYLSVWSVCLFQLAFTVTCFFQNREPFKQFSLNMLAVFPIYIPIYAFWAFAVSKRLYADGKIHITNRDLVIAVFTHFPINLFNHMLFNANNYDSSNYLLVFSTIFAYACCLFVLYLHRMFVRQAKLNQEIDIINELWQQRQTQYEVTSCNIEFINRKTHDFMHTLTELYTLDDSNLRREFLDELSMKLRVYDAFVDTGNRALDTILSQANLPSVDKGTHGRKRANFCPCFVAFLPRTSSTRQSSALQGQKLTSFRLSDPDHRYSGHLQGGRLRRTGRTLIEDNAENDRNIMVQGVCPFVH